MLEVSIEVLKKAILDLHGCDSTWVESVPFKETFQGKVVWDGVVQVFDLKGHPTAARAYAWSHRTRQKAKIHCCVTSGASGFARKSSQSINSTTITQGGVLDG